MSTTDPAAGNPFPYLPNPRSAGNSAPANPADSSHGADPVDDGHPPRCAGCGQPIGYWAIDRLTGVLDRWGLDDQAPTLLDRAARRDRLVALFLIDLDHFKRINDSAGHLAGDRALLAAATVLRDLTGPDDVLARFGGDEFVLLAEPPSRWHALATARRIRGRIRDVTARAPRSAERPPGCTASIGLACAIPEGRADFAGLLREADQALFAAKRQGRDRACLADSDPEGTGSRRRWITDPPALDLRDSDPAPPASRPVRRRNPCLGAVVPH